MTGADWTIIALVSLIMLGLTFRRRFGPILDPLKKRMGESWDTMIRAMQLVTVGVWILIWLLVDDTRRAELQRFFEENAPWMTGW
ncbi:MAG: hypothetical protein OQJ99_01970 [Rhodospirillales bacterium]|nr:hypothetical protein [Rhodospirillales bacterium]MCW8862143.1 hypothetical protein [Rhodospirillales bacterium]MCW9040211.1 hypothetical protein [Rhodospirillales bacterium]